MQVQKEKPDLSNFAEVTQQKLQSYFQWHRIQKNRQAIPIVSTQIRKSIRQMCKDEAQQNLVLENIIPILTSLFKKESYQACSILHEILSAEFKYVCKQQKMEQQAPKVQQNTVIALPSQDESIFNSSYQSDNLKVVVHKDYADGKSNGTKNASVYISQSQCYQEDQLQLPFFLSEDKQVLLKIVDREQISKFFCRVAGAINWNLLQRLEQLQLKKRKEKFIQKLLEIIQSVSPSFYTFYLMKIMTYIEAQVLQYFKTAAQTKQKAFFSNFNIEIFEKILWTINSINQRWNDQEIQKVEIKALLKCTTIEWQWQIKKIVYELLLQSSISQQQLYSAKQLCELTRRAQMQMSGPKSEQIVAYVRSHDILRKIYRADNHPQVIIKGKDVFQFVASSLQGIDQKQLGMLFNLLDKSHQQVCKALYITIQNIGQKNLQKHRQYMISEICKFNRATLFIDQTFCLMQMLILLTPLQELQKGLDKLYQIMDQHYLKLRKEMKQRIMNIYFELFIMGVQENVFGKDSMEMIDQVDQKEKTAIQKQSLTALQPIKHKLKSQMAFVMIQTFVQLLQKQKGRKIEAACQKILVNTINLLFSKYKIHKICIQNSGEQKKSQLKMLAKLLRIYDGLVPKAEDRAILTNDQISELIGQQHAFCEFLYLYSQEKQLEVLRFLFNKYFNEKQSDFKTSHQDFLQVYLLTNQNAKKEILPQIQQRLFQCKLSGLKQKLAKVYFQIAQIQIRKLVAQIKLEYDKIIQDSRDKSKKVPKFWALILLYRFKLQQADKNGYGSHPPFKPTGGSQQVSIKLVNSLDVLIPTESIFEINKQKTIKELVYRIMEIVHMPIQKLKIKLNEKFLVLNDFYSKVNDMCPYNESTITVYESTTSEWFDKCQLLTDGTLTTNVVAALKQIHMKYAENGRLYRRNFAKIFQIVTQTDKIQVSDARIIQIYNKFTETDQFMTLEQWLNFYFESSVMNPCLVVQNLKRLGYKHLFKTPDFMNEMIVQQNQVRTLAVQSTKTQKGQIPNIYEILLNAKTEDFSVQRLSVKILEALPMNTEVIKLIEKQNHQSMIDEKQQQQNNLKLWYYSRVISRLIHKRSDSQEVLSIANQENWCDRVYQSKIYKKLIKASIKKISTIQKKIQYELFSQYIRQALQNIISIEGARFIQISAQFQKEISDINPIDISKLINIIPQQQDLSYLQSVSMELILKISLDDPSVKISESAGLIVIVRNLTIMFLLSIPKRLQKNPNFTIKADPQLIFHGNKQLRKIFNVFYVLISKIFSPEIKNAYHKIECRSNSKQYFSALLKFIMEQQDANDQFYSKIGHQIGELLLEQSKKHALYHHILNNRASTKQQLKQQAQNEQIIIGRLKVLKLIQLLSPNLKQAQNAEGWLEKIENLCYTPQIRQHYYQLTNKFYGPGYNLQKIWQLVSKTKPQRNSIYKNKDKRFMGLYNLGCICYINATLQQLFMIEPFRNLILSIKQNSQSRKLVLSQENNNYFKHFQQIFYQLAFGSRGFFVPQKFCQNFRDYTGQPIDVKQQQDADQFLNRLLDRLEGTLQNIENKEKQSEEMIEQGAIQKIEKISPNNKKLVQVIHQNLSGTMVNTIQCQNCLTNKNKFEKFYVLTLQINDRKSLTECLDKMIQPQIICDYFCEQCEAKVQTIHKFHSFDTLPPYLFIHLQRLVFDLQSFSKVRLDTIIDFPLEIDLSKYFYDVQHGKSSKRQQNIYQLRGFVVHVGNSESGHYYSLIKQTQWIAQYYSRTKWTKFDDSRIDSWDWSFGSHQKQNAYILIYQKKKPNPKSSMEVERNCPEIVCPKYQDLDPAMLQFINQDNSQLYKEMIVLDYNFPKYVDRTLSRIMIPNALTGSEPNNLLVPYHPEYRALDNKMCYDQMKKSLRIILKYFDFISQIKDAGLQYSVIMDESKADSITNKVSGPAIKRLTYYFIMFVHLIPEEAEPLLQQYYEKGINTIISHPEFILREAFRLIMVKLFSIVLFNRQNMLLIHLPKFLQNAFVQIQSGLQIAGRNPGRMNQFFDFLFELCSLSQLCIQWLNTNQFAPKLVHFMMQGDSHLKDDLKNLPNFSLGGKKYECFNVILKTLQILLIHLIQKKRIQGKIVLKQALDGVYMKAFGRFDFYRRMLQQRYQYHSLNRILCIFCYENSDLTDKVSKFLKSAINRQSYKDSYIYAYLYLIHGFLAIEDSLQMKRIYTILGVPVLNLSEFINTQKQQNSQKMEVQMQDFSKKDDNKYQNNRILYYRSFNQQDGDQFLMPLLEVLYLNRNQLTYFSILSAVTLLRLMKGSKKIQQYVLKMPCSMNQKRNICQPDQASIIKMSYIEWIPRFLQFLLNNGDLLPPSIDKNYQPIKRIPLIDLNEHEIANQIAKMLSEIQNKFDHSELMQDESIENLQQQLKKKESQVLERSYLEIINQFYPLSQVLLKDSEAQKIQLKQIYITNHSQVEQQGQAESSEQKYARLIELYYKRIQQSNQMQKLQDRFIQLRLKTECQCVFHFNYWCYQFSMFFKVGQYDIILPISNQKQLINSIKIEIISIPKNRNRKGKTQNLRQKEKQGQKPCGNDQNPIVMTDEFPTTYEAYQAEGQNNNFSAQKNNNDSANFCFECPFCCYTSSNYSSRCISCGQELGELL